MNAHKVMTPYANWSVFLLPPQDTVDAAIAMFMLSKDVQLQRYIPCVVPV